MPAGRGPGPPNPRRDHIGDHCLGADVCETCLPRAPFAQRDAGARDLVDHVESREQKIVFVARGLPGQGRSQTFLHPPPSSFATIRSQAVHTRATSILLSSAASYQNHFVRAFASAPRDVLRLRALPARRVVSHAVVQLAVAQRELRHWPGRSVRHRRQFDDGIICHGRYGLKDHVAGTLDGPLRIAPGAVVSADEVPHLGPAGARLRHARHRPCRRQ
jgi:hypothetical protein